MTDKLTPGQLRDLANALVASDDRKHALTECEKMLYRISHTLEKEAARREAEAPPPTAPDLVEYAIDWLRYSAPPNYAAAIEALRAERDAAVKLAQSRLEAGEALLNAASLHKARAEAAEAQVAALRGALESIAACDISDQQFITLGPGFGALRQLREAARLARTALAGGKHD